VPNVHVFVDNRPATKNVMQGVSLHRVHMSGFEVHGNVETF